MISLPILSSFMSTKCKNLLILSNINITTNQLPINHTQEMIKLQLKIRSLEYMINSNHLVTVILFLLSLMTMQSAQIAEDLLMMKTGASITKKVVMLMDLIKICKSAISLTQ